MTQMHRVEVKIKGDLPLLIYVLIWPFLYMLVEVDALHFYFNHELIFIDLRLLFYFLFIILVVLKILGGYNKDKQIVLMIILLFAFCYLMSFTANMSIESDYKQFINGFVLFAIVLIYTVLYSDTIHWDRIAKAYAFSVIIITVSGYYSFYRFLTEYGFEVVSGSLSEQLFRFCGRRTVYVPAILILATMTFSFVDRGIKSRVMLIALALGNISLLMSSQRTALIVLFYEVFVMLLYFRSRTVFVILLFLTVASIVYIKEIMFYFELTFFNKLNAVYFGTEAGRQEIWTAAFGALTSDIKHFFFGVSEGGLPVVYGPQWPVAADNPDNFLLYLWASCGIVGLALFIVIISYLAYMVHRNRIFYNVLFYWLFIAYISLAGFGFYIDSVRSDFLNLGIVIIFVGFLVKNRRLSSDMQHVV